LLAAMTHVTPTSIAWTAAEAPEIIVTPLVVIVQAATTVPMAMRMTPGVPVSSYAMGVTVVSTLFTCFVALVL